MRPVAPTTSDRMLRAFRALVKSQLPTFPFQCVYEYAVQAVAADGSTADASPTDGTIPIPPIVKIPLQLPGHTAKLAIGSRCLITFINGDPGRPAVISGAPVPVNATYDATATLAVGPSAAAVNIAGGADFVARATQTQSVVTALQVFAAAPNWVTIVTAGAAAGVLLTALTGLTVATTKTKAT